MILDILPLAGGTARLVRVYGGEPCVKLPGAVPAPEGEGQWPITELGDYCFSEKPRGLPGPEKICRYERAEDGKLCLTRAFGRDVSGKERYSFDFAAPAAPAQDDELHPICGNLSSRRWGGARRPAPGRRGRRSQSCTSLCRSHPGQKHGSDRACRPRPAHSGRSFPARADPGAFRKNSNLPVR